jgi:hypothetical protein
MRPRLRPALRLLRVLAFLGFTGCVAVATTAATSPAIDSAFDIAVYLALVVHIARRRLDRRAADRQ